MATARIGLFPAGSEIWGDWCAPEGLEPMVSGHVACMHSNLSRLNVGIAALSNCMGANFFVPGTQSLSPLTVSAWGSKQVRPTSQSFLKWSHEAG